MSNTVLTMAGLAAITVLAIQRQLARTSNAGTRKESGTAKTCPRCRARIAAADVECPDCNVPLQIYELVSAPIVTEAPGASDAPPRALIRSDLCVGCGSCVDACPEPGALTMRDKLAVVDPSRCKGHGECIPACPLGAISVVRGNAANRVVVPFVDAHFETSVPGLYIVGELGGRALIKNAVNEGRVAGEHVATSAARRRKAAPTNDFVDVVVVGSGPSGLSAGLTAHRAGLDYVLLEQGSLAETVRTYPRHKVLFAEPLTMPLYGDLWVSDASKEALLTIWERIIGRAGLRVHSQQRVHEIAPVAGGFRVATATAMYHTHAVILAMECVSCHRTAYAQTTSPPHAAAGFGTECQSCHSSTTWTGVPFNHDNTRFVLTGAHRAASCAGCHGNGAYRGRSMDCVSCHQTSYNQTMAPPHAAAGFPTSCQTCHTTTAWAGSPFDHATTQFPLTGAHRAATCASCHGDGVYAGRPASCVSCHRVAYDATTNPPHAAAGFSVGCETCHTTSAWPGAVFSHDATQFALTGAHRATSCASCHGDGVYRGKPTACVSCHQSDYNRTAAPAHGAAGFPTTCQTCHTTTAWLGAPFNHDATQFALTGAHRATTCAACHGDGVYRGKPTACVSCHQNDYNRTTTPAHVAAGFPTTCQNCHTTTGWPGATFNHSATAFALTGAHQTAACGSCHGGGVYRGTPTTCVSCHLAAYTGTTAPNHASAGFPTDCASCHTTTRWTGATFDHDARYFPIYSGAHRNRWNSCSTCHTNPTNYSVFNCLSCHGKSETDSHHREQPGYVYASPSCYACHPQGRSE